MNSTIPKVYSYARISSAQQKAGGGIARQVENARKWAKSQGRLFDESTVLIDEGLSSYHGVHKLKGVFGKFLKAVENGHIAKGSVLYVESLDRFSRQHITKSLPDFLNLINSGITIVADGQEFSEKTLDTIELISCLVYLTRAHDESQKKSERLSSAWAQKRQKASKGEMVTTRCPAWIDTEGVKHIGSRLVAGKFILNKERAKVVNDIFKSYLKGWGVIKIASELNTNGILPWYTRQKRTDNAPYEWDKSNVMKILISKATYGEHTLRQQINGKFENVGEPISNYYPAAIKKEVWERAALRRERNKTTGGRTRKQRYTSLFQGVLKCPYCGNNFVISERSKINAAGEKITYFYLICKSKRYSKSCHFPTFRYEPLERAILTVLSDKVIVDMDESAQEARDELKNEIMALETEAISKQEQVERLLDLVAKGSEKASKRVLNRIDKTDQEIESLAETVKAKTKEFLNMVNEKEGTQDKVDRVQALHDRMYDLLNVMKKDRCSKEVLEIRRNLIVEIQSSVERIYFSDLEDEGFKIYVLFHRDSTGQGVYRDATLNDSLEPIGYIDSKRRADDGDLWFINEGNYIPETV